MKTNKTSLAVFTLLLSFLAVDCGNGKQQEGGKEMKGNNSSVEVRSPAVAGQFYPANPLVLRQEIEDYLNEAQSFPEYQPFALIAPHAGYIYSGWVAGFSYRQVKGKKYDAVIVISPCHIEYFDFSSVLCKGYYQTPLGEIPLAEDLARQICKVHPSVIESRQGHFSGRGRGEHALEVQLPFLQVALGDFKLVPIVMGDQSWENCRELGEAIGRACKGKNVLIAASSDLSHFHSYREAQKLDSSLINMLEEYKPEETCRQLNNRKLEACGGGPIVSAMVAGKILGAEGLKVLKYANSGDVPIGGKDSVVGYLAGVIYKKAESRENQLIEEEAEVMENPGEGLILAEKRQLMEIARTTVDCVVRDKPVPEFVPISEALKQERGAFVTLKIAGQLRGCIGYILPVKPLYLTVQEVAETAALLDPRFPPVSVKELPKLEYEISALTPVRKISDISEIVVGKHGIIIRRGYNQGLLLPQVATEYGWDRETFLAHACNKAGLPSDAWKKAGTEISVFSAEVFDENDVK